MQNLIIKNFFGSFSTPFLLKSSILVLLLFILPCLEVFNYSTLSLCMEEPGNPTPTPAPSLNDHINAAGASSDLFNQARIAIQPFFNQLGENLGTYNDNFSEPEKRQHWGTMGKVGITTALAGAGIGMKAKINVAGSASIGALSSNAAYLAYLSSTAEGRKQKKLIEAAEQKKRAAIQAAEENAADQALNPGVHQVSVDIPEKGVPFNNFSDAPKKVDRSFNPTPLEMGEGETYVPRVPRRLMGDDTVTNRMIHRFAFPGIPEKGPDTSDDLANVGKTILRDSLGTPPGTPTKTASNFDGLESVNSDTSNTSDNLADVGKTALRNSLGTPPGSPVDMTGFF